MAHKSENESLTSTHGTEPHPDEDSNDVDLMTRFLLIVVSGVVVLIFGAACIWAWCRRRGSITVLGDSDTRLPKYTLPKAAKGKAKPGDYEYVEARVKQPEDYLSVRPSRKQARARKTSPTRVAPHQDDVKTVREKYSPEDRTKSRFWRSWLQSKQKTPGYKLKSASVTSLETGAKVKQAGAGVIKAPEEETEQPPIEVDTYKSCSVVSVDLGLTQKVQKTAATPGSKEAIVLQGPKSGTSLVAKQAPARPPSSIPLVPKLKDPKAEPATPPETAKPKQTLEKVAEPPGQPAPARPAPESPAQSPPDLPKSHQAPARKRRESLQNEVKGLKKAPDVEPHEKDPIPKAELPKHPTSKAEPKVPVKIVEKLPTEKRPEIPRSTRQLPVTSPVSSPPKTNSGQPSALEASPKSSRESKTTRTATGKQSLMKSLTKKAETAAGPAEPVIAKSRRVASPLPRSDSSLSAGTHTVSVVDARKSEKAKTPKASM